MIPSKNPLLTSWQAEVIGLLWVFCILGFSWQSYAATGTEGAAFLNIPVGAGPAALGSAYTALATDAYAPTWNPAGLGETDSTQISGQHLSYADSLNYEYMSIVHPVHAGFGIGASLQYFGSGSFTGLNENAVPTGNYSSYYSAYSFSAGQRLESGLSLGATAKMVHASIDGLGASAYAGDFGALYPVNNRLRLAATLTNVGTPLRFIDQSDSLASAAHLGLAWQTTRSLDIVMEGVYQRTGPGSGHFGVEWRPVPMIALRAGYRTDTVQGLSPVAGLTTGFGLNLWGQELAYAWLPLGPLGDTQYLSFVIRFGQAERARRNLIQYNQMGSHRNVRNDKQEEDIQQLMMLLDQYDKTVVAKQNAANQTMRNQ